LFDGSKRYPPDQPVSCLSNSREKLVSHDGETVSTDTVERPERKGRLLVGDDEPRLLGSLCAILRTEGFEVDAAANGAAVCRRAQLTSYELILLNISMPGKDGFDVLSWLKDTGRETAVVIISGFSDYRTIRRAFRLGARDYLLKPYDVDELVRLVGDTIRAQRQVCRTADIQRADSRANEFFEQALDHLPDLVFSLDRHKRINYLNNRAEQLLGASERKLIGQPFAEIVHKDDLRKIPLLFDEVGDGASTTREITLLTGNGDSVSLACEITVVSMPGSAPSGSVSFLGSARDITQRNQALALMEFQASHDALTGLPNRTLFLDRLALAVSQASRNGQKLAVFFIDLNDFKAVNDTHGHRVGDELLQQVAESLKQCLREGDTLARYGGDEFTVMLPTIDVKQDAATVAYKLLKTLDTPFLLDGVGIRLSVGSSIGIAMFPDDGIDVGSLLERADQAMYGVKQAGKNDFHFYS
jgi:diguanylate cyclase (GGDEF)-like protein/PAS domain S-box-containing protein